MKKLTIIVVILFLWIITVGVRAQTGVFGWTTLENPPFPTNDTAILEESQEVYTNIPIIPGYNNQNSLKVSITNNGTGYLFLTSTFPSTRVFPASGTSFVVKEMIIQGQYLDIKPIFLYNNEWYRPENQSITNLQDNWKVVNISNWTSISTNQPYILDSIYIDTCYLWLLYNSDGEYYFDTWYYYDGNSPKLICGFGDVLSGLENLNYQTPSNYSLLQNYPNPFNPNTKIEFSVPKASDIEILIYDIFGRKIKTLEKDFYQQGQYQVVWDGKDSNGNLATSGTYFYQMTGDDFVQTKKMILLK